MNTAIPSFLFPFMLYGTAATFAALAYGLDRSLKMAGWQTRDRIRAVAGGVALLAAIYLTALIPARLGLYRGVTSRVPTIQFGILAPIVIGLLLFFTWRPFRATVAAVPQQWLVGLQLYRAEGLIFLLLYASGRLPGEFALPAGIGDVAVGLFAPLVAMAVVRKRSYAPALVRAWNLIGLADLTVAMTTGFLTSPSPIQRLALNHPNELIGQYPLVMIPVFLVPLAILLHVASLLRLRQRESQPQPGRVLQVEPTY